MFSIAVCRKDLCIPSLDGCDAQITLKNCKKELTESRTPALPVSEYNGNDLDDTDNKSYGMKINSSDKVANENRGGNNKKCEVENPFNIFQCTAKDGKVKDKFNKKCDILYSAKNRSSKILENLASVSKQHDKGSLSGPSKALSQRMVKDHNAKEKNNRRCDVVESAIKEASLMILEISDTENGQQKGLLSDSSRGFSGKAVIDDNIIEKFSQNHDIEESVKNKESRIHTEILDKGIDKCHNGSLSSPSEGPQTMNTGDLTKTCPNSEEDTSKKLNSKLRVYHYRRKNNLSAQHCENVKEDMIDSKVDTVDFLTHHTQTRDEKISRDETDAIISCNQQFETKTKHNVEVPDSEELQNALALLYRKRQELYLQMCNMEDTLALYEDNIARIRNGHEVDLARQCIKSIISGSDQLLLENGTENQDKGHRPGEDNHKSQSEKQSRLSEAYLPGKSSCQDLEYICLKNNWRLPRYFIEPSNGKFASGVIVQAKDMKLSLKGSFESKPCEARESAANQMIAKIQNFVL